MLSSSSCTSSLRQQSLLKTPSPAARSATLGARSAVRNSACTTGKGFPTTVMFVLARATCAPAFPKTSIPRAVIACLKCVCGGGGGRVFFAEANGGLKIKTEVSG